MVDICKVKYDTDTIDRFDKNTLGCEIVLEDLKAQYGMYKRIHGWIRPQQLLLEFTDLSSLISWPKASTETSLLLIKWYISHAQFLRVVHTTYYSTNHERS